MTKLLPKGLSRRERQIMTILYDREEASVADVLESLPDPPSYSTVRALLKILEDKGHLRHVEKGARYVYSPTLTWAAVARSAMEQVVESFFGGNVEQAVATLLTNTKSRPSEEELARLEELIRRAKSEEGRDGGTGE